MILDQIGTFCVIKIETLPLVIAAACYKHDKKTKIWD